MHESEKCLVFTIPISKLQPSQRYIRCVPFTPAIIHPIDIYYLCAIFD